jgi:hypothetical protein
MQSRIAKQVLEGLVSSPGALWPPIADNRPWSVELITVSLVFVLGCDCGGGEQTRPGSTILRTR